MPRLPSRFAAVILCVAPLFFQRSWRHAEVPLVGAILPPGRRTVAGILLPPGRRTVAGILLPPGRRTVAGILLPPGRRTVAGILRITGLARERRFVNYHRTLNRAAWDPRAASRLLLGLLLDAFAPRGPVLLGLDDTIERRRGRRIAAKGIYRDPVRSSRGHLVKASGLRWLGLMLLVPVPWAGRAWALPFPAALAPSERHRGERGRRHKTSTDRGRQMVLQARR